MPLAARVEPQIDMVAENQTPSPSLSLREYKYVPTLVVVGYNRPRSLQRVLDSIAESHCPAGVKMVISIDKGTEGDTANQRTLEVAQAFEWTRGEKRVIFREENQNLPNHILVCADLSEEYGAVMIIEDDLYLAPNFYQYALEATNFYGDDERIAGVGLYQIAHNNHAYNLPFCPVKDGSSVFFTQGPCSWGQVWTWEQWQKFRTWWDQKTGFSAEDQIPEGIKSWGDRAWDNHFNKYLMETNRYFVFPHEGYSTNFTEDGTHFSGGSNFYQCVLQMGQVPLQFKSLDESLARYDTYFELKPEVINQFVPELQQYDYIVDLYGTKQLNIFEETYVLTLREVDNPIMTFGAEMKPFEMNLLLNRTGTGINLVNKAELQVSELRPPQSIFDYHFSFLPIKVLMKLLRSRVKARIS